MGVGRFCGGGTRTGVRTRAHGRVAARARVARVRQEARARAHLDDGAAEGLVRVREHREQLGLAAVQLLRDGGHQGELLRRTSMKHQI
eukprot:4682935-Pleurochrysis_carterae.AAC.1